MTDIGQDSLLQGAKLWGAYDPLNATTGSVVTINSSVNPPTLGFTSPGSIGSVPNNRIMTGSTTGGPYRNLQIVNNNQIQNSQANGTVDIIPNGTGGINLFTTYSGGGSTVLTLGDTVTTTSKTFFYQDTANNWFRCSSQNVGGSIPMAINNVLIGGGSVLGCTIQAATGSQLLISFTGANAVTFITNSTSVPVYFADTSNTSRLMSIAYDATNEWGTLGTQKIGAGYVPMVVNSNGVLIVANGASVTSDAAAIICGGSPYNVTTIPVGASPLASKMIDVFGTVQSNFPNAGNMYTTYGVTAITHTGGTGVYVLTLSTSVFTNNLSVMVLCNVVSTTAATIRGSITSTTPLQATFYTFNAAGVATDLTFYYLIKGY